VNEGLQLASELGDVVLLLGHHLPHPGELSRKEQRVDRFAHEIRRLAAGLSRGRDERLF
jgi:hypothetical protein